MILWKSAQNKAQHIFVVIIISNFFCVWRYPEIGILLLF
jgi:hypothetical protein